MNVEKMRAIGQAILAEPRRFNMGFWGAAFGDAVDQGHAKTARPPCGTVCCFAGEWALLYTDTSPEKLRKRDEFHGTIADMAQKDLDLPNTDLFHSLFWPGNLRHPASMKSGTKRYAEHFVNVVLESYIRTNGWTKPDQVEPPLGGA